MSNRILFAQLTKVDAEQRLVFGRAVQEVPDRSGEVFDYASSKPYFEAWSKSQSEASLGKSSGNVREMHKGDAAGILVPGTGIVFNDAEKSVDICAHVVDDNAWNKVLKGVYTGFSIGGSYAKKWEDTDMKKTRYTANPSEVSLVDRPCVPTSTFFEIHKADGVVEKVDFVAPVDEPAKSFNRREAVNELVAKGVKAETLIGASDAELDAMIKFGSVTVENGKEVAKTSGTDANEEPAIEVTGSDAEVATFGKLLNDNKLSMADAILAVQKHVKPEPMQKMLVGAASTFADEINKRFPLDTADHVRAAWNYIGKAAVKYTVDELELVKGRIEAAWKDKIDKAGPPVVKVGEVAGLAKSILEHVDALKALNKKDGGAATTPEEDAVLLVKGEAIALRKGLYTCGSFAQLLGSLVGIMQSCEYEAASEGDNSPVCGKLNDAIKVLGDILVEMVQEEVGEAVAGDESPMMQMAKEVVARADDLAKRGARNSANDLAKIQGMHDHAVGLGAQCAQKAASNGMTMAQAVEFCKGQGIAAPSDDEVKKVMEQHAVHESPEAVLVKSLTVEKEDLTKLLSTANETLAKVTDELKKLQAQPAPSKVRLRVLEKGQDIADAATTVVEPVKKADGTVDDVATAIKKAQQTGGRPLVAG